MKSLVTEPPPVQQIVHATLIDETTLSVLPGWLCSQTTLVSICLSPRSLCQNGIRHASDSLGVMSMVESERTIRPRYRSDPSWGRAGRKEVKWKSLRLQCSSKKVGQGQWMVFEPNCSLSPVTPRMSLPCYSCHIQSLAGSSQHMGSEALSCTPCRSGKSTPHKVKEGTFSCNNLLNINARNKTKMESTQALAITTNVWELQGTEEHSCATTGIESAKFRLQGHL